MSGWRLQFRLWHLSLAVLVCSLVFVCARTVWRGGAVELAMLVWVSVGIVAGHAVGIAFWALIGRGP